MLQYQKDYWIVALNPSVTCFLWILLPQQTTKITMFTASHSVHTYPNVAYWQLSLIKSLHEEIFYKATLSSTFSPDEPKYMTVQDTHTHTHPHRIWQMIILRQMTSFRYLAAAMYIILSVCNSVIPVPHKLGHSLTYASVDDCHHTLPILTSKS
jgi:hypothetical protein